MSGYSDRKIRRLLSGFTLLETLFVAAIGLWIVVIVTQLVLSSLQMGKVITSEATLTTESRKGWDLMLQDIQSSTYVLATYSSGTYGTFTWDTGKTLILSAPSYDSSYQTQALSSSDIIIYHLVGTSAPYTLKRIVVPAAGSVRSAVADAVVAQDVNSLQFTYLADLPKTSDGSTKVYTLSGTSASTTLGGIDGAPSVTVAGAARTSGVTFSSSSLTFSSAPASGNAIDIVYPLSTSLAANAPFANAIVVTLNVASTDPSMRPTSPPSVLLTGTAYLRNHP